LNPLDEALLADEQLDLIITEADMREGASNTFMYQANAIYCIRQDLNEIFGVSDDTHLIWAMEMERAKKAAVPVLVPESL
jgi:hypothetical protein